jgi:hypothetical protein
LGNGAPSGARGGESRAEGVVTAEGVAPGKTSGEQASPLRLRSTELLGETTMPEDEEKKEGEQEPEEEVLDEWKVRFKDGTVFAPVTYDLLVEWYESGQIGEDSPVARNALTAEWLPFKETEGFAAAKAKKEGGQIFCTSCGSPWLVGTKLCTNCGTNLETGEKLLGVGEKPAGTVKLRRKLAAAPTAPSEPPRGGVAVPEVSAAAEVAEAPPAEAVVPAEAGIEAEEAVAPAKPQKKGKKLVVKLAVVVVIVVAAVAVLAPDQLSKIKEKVTGLFGGKGHGARGRGKELAESRLGGTESAPVESLEQYISKTLSTMPFAAQRRADFDSEVKNFLSIAASQFSDADVFTSVVRALTGGDLRDGARLLEEEKARLGADFATPMLDAMLGSVKVLLGKEEGTNLLTSAVEDADVARMAVSFCRGAIEGCLERLLLEQGKKDPWGAVAQILGKTKEEIGDEFLARHAGRALAGLATVRAFMGEAGGEKKGVRTKAFLRFFGQGNPSVQAGLVELGRRKPGKGSSVLRHEPVRVAYAIRLLSEPEEGANEEDVGLVDLLKEGQSSHPENAFYNYALAAAYLRQSKIDEASAEIKAGNEKPAYRDFRKERMEGLAKILDAPMPYTAAGLSVSSGHLSAMANSSRSLLDAAGSFFRVGRRQDAFEILGGWRKMCERLRTEASTLNDVLTVVNMAVPFMAMEAEYYKRGGEQAKAWAVRKVLVEADRWAMAISYGATYGPMAEVFVKEVFSEKGYEEEFARTSPQEILESILAKGTERLEAMLKQDPATVPLMGVNLQDPYYAQAKQALDEARYERAYEFGYACLVRSPGHVWAFRVMDDAVKNTSVAGELEGAGPVAYLVVAKRDASSVAASRVAYEIEVAKGTTKEEAIATVRTALQGFLRREKPDAVRIDLRLEGSRMPFVRLDWAPGGDWDKARAGTPDAEFKERLTEF